MPIYWKKKFKPELILSKISHARTVTLEGSVSFSGFEFHEHMPVLASMLQFPKAAERLNKSGLIWSALSQVKGTLDKDSFIEAINKSLRKKLSTKITDYVLITSLSITSNKDIPRSFRMIDSSIRFLPNGIPKNYSVRRKILESHRIDIPDTPINYLPISIAVRDKSATAAAQQAIDQIDLFRGIAALYLNLAMQWDFGGKTSQDPINRVRCGGRHTIHTPDGNVAATTLWFEPNFRPAKLYAIENPTSLFKAIRRDLTSITKSPYVKELIAALIRYARAFDECDANSAFIKLWSALEMLTTPDIADYSKMTKRCSFLYTDMDYHHQVLEHLRDYRNRSVHSGIEGEDARANCFLLQQYFRTAVHFYKGNYREFSSLNDANDFLDLPSDFSILSARIKALRKAQKFITPLAT